MIEGTSDAEARLVEDVRIDHGSGHVLMPEQLLDGSDIIARLQQVRGKRVPEDECRKV